MATTTTTRNPPLEFITSNPAMDAYNEGQAQAQRQAAADLQIESQQLKNAEDLRAAPTRLRKIQADADTARAGADVAQGTVAAKISHEKSNAALAGTNAGVAAATAPYRIQDAYNTSRGNAADADVKVATAPYTVQNAGNAARSTESNTNVTVATEPERIAEAKTRLRAANANAKNAEMQPFYKSLDLLNQGRTEEAKQLAAEAGQSIPEEVINNSEVRAALTGAAKYAQELYPNRPRDQHAYIKGFIEDMAARKQQGQPVNTPTAPYSVPNAPEPPEDTNKDSYDLVYKETIDPVTGQKVIKSYNHSRATGELTEIEGEGAFNKVTGAGGGGGGRTSVFQQKQTAWLAVHPNDSQGALDYASGRRALSMPELNKAAMQMAQKEISGNMQLKFRNVVEQQQAIDKRAKEILQLLQGAPAAAPPAAPGAPPAPAAPGAAAPPPPGAGTQSNPFQATTQDQINWFMAHAQPGQVIIVDGKPYTK